ncbi:hypothetical protein CFP56_023463 [Quercus suber]|uniref:Uncharacterized protein n=1 Tax=Quercus suber TaxID=58331 RepID=A0AAW0K9Y1_QUESU
MGVQMVILSHLFSGSNKKRALVDSANSMLEIQKFSSSSGVDDPSTSLDCVGSNVRLCSRSFITPIIGTVTSNTEGDSNEELQESSNQIAAKSRKCSRPFIWLHHRKRRHLNFEETGIKTSSATTLTEKDSVSGRLQDDVNSCLNSCEKSHNVVSGCNLTYLYMKKILRYT